MFYHAVRKTNSDNQSEIKDMNMRDYSTLHLYMNSSKGTALLLRLYRINIVNRAHSLECNRCSILFFN